MSASVLALIVANLVPLYGVFRLHWPVFPILLLFWMENVVVGVFNVFKMLVASPAEPATWLTKSVMIPFFCVHYGMFTLVHGIFVFVLFGGYATSGASFPDSGSVVDAIAGFSEAAKKGAESTRDMISRIGRSSRLGERTLGHQDAGATSCYFILDAFYQGAK